MTVSLPEKFTAEQAFEAHDDGEPIMVSRAWVRETVAAHGLPLAEFDRDMPFLTDYDAADVLGWLGY